MLRGVESLALSNVTQIQDQSAAIRFVSFVDRAYEGQISIRNSGLPLTDVFRADHLEGGYRKKYLRAISRIGAMTSAA
jgi:cell division protein ZapE